MQQQQNQQQQQQQQSICDKSGKFPVIFWHCEGGAIHKINMENCWLYNISPLSVEHTSRMKRFPRCFRRLLYYISPNRKIMRSIRARCPGVVWWGFSRQFTNVRITVRSMSLFTIPHARFFQCCQWLSVNARIHVCISTNVWWYSKDSCLLAIHVIPNEVTIGVQEPRSHRLGDSLTQMVNELGI